MRQKHDRRQFLEGLSFAFSLIPLQGWATPLETVPGSGPLLITPSAQMLAWRLDPAFFVAVWRGALPFARPGVHTATLSRKREAAFLQALVELVDGPQAILLPELQMVSALFRSSWGCYVASGQTELLQDLSSEKSELVLQGMATSSLQHRRQIQQGLVSFVSMVHFGAETLEGDGGYPGVPSHVRGIWGESA